MNIAQELFAVFFAIFWGTSSNAWPRWKPFNWPIVLSSRRVFCRVALSMTLLNCLPVVYFAVVLGVMAGQQCEPKNWAWNRWFLEAVCGIVPAFAAFGFYRIWMAFIALIPNVFYYNNETLPAEFKLYAKESISVEPTIETIPVHHRWWKGELLVGLLYVLVPFALFLTANWLR